MTKEQVIELAKQAGGTEMQPYDYGAKPDRFIIQHEALERFARLVGNAKLEEAAFRFEDLHLYGTKTTDTKGCAAIIRNMKENNA